ncbi:PASTA domain-containing protein [Nocardia puris]|nr:PASTA domain-containing protein [Nocardia puris]
MLAAAAVLATGCEALTELDRDANATMPNVVGMQLDEARKTLGRLDLDVQVQDDTGANRNVWVDSNWTVTRQEIPTDTPLGTTTDVTIGVVKHGETPQTPEPQPTSAAPPSAAPPAEPAPQPPPSTPSPLRNACLLLDASALQAAQMSPQLQDARTAWRTSANDVDTHACANDLDEVTIHVDVHPEPQSARSDADYATQISDDPYNPFKSGVRLPFDGSRGGAKLISTELGISRVSWSNGVHSVLLEINSDPEVPGLPSRHPFDTLNRLIDQIVEHADSLIASGRW